jgi:opacity protein-like surface antigen
MKRVGVAVLALLAGGVATANAADPPMPVLRERVPVVLWTWTGLYAGTHLGGGFGLTHFKHQPATSIYGDTVRSPMALGGAQLGYNWHIPDTSFVLGVEADASMIGSDGTNTCLASSGAFLSANCHVRQAFTGSLAARAGFATGPDQRTLLFVKGGAAALHQMIDITTNGAWPPASANTNSTRFGWTAGAGVERALTPAWSMKLEYDYMDFGTEKVATPASYLQALSGVNAYFPLPAGTADARQGVHAVKLGVNLRLGEDSHATWPLRGAVRDASPGAEIEVGTRVWYSFGRHQKDLGGSTLPAAQNFLVSRLTYDTSSYSGEAFARVDTDQGFFVKGFGGAGRSLSGKMHDEDWLIAGGTIPYSNTLSSPVKERLAYATVDVGYALFKGANTKVGGFIGYNYLKDDNSAFGCVQIATPNSVCSTPIPNTTLAITQNNEWHSFRLGLNGVVSLGNGITLTGDAAYLPAVSFSGVDNHVLRTDVPDTVSKEKGFGQGVQLEALLAYAFNQSFSVGAGGRYWAMWANDGALTNIFGTLCPCQTLPSRTERYGGFVQASYKFNALR